MMRARGAFTLLEVLITVVIVGILVAAALPFYRRTLERQYRSQARDILFAIYAGERVYFFENLNTYKAITVPADWDAIFMETPNAPQVPVTFTVTAVAGPPSTFVATARRTSPPGGGDCRMTINQTRTIDMSNWGIDQPPGCPP